MKNVKTGKYLAAAAAGAMMFTGAAAQAGVVTFSPGTPTAIGIAALTGSGTHFDGTAVKTDRINMVAVNDTVSSNGTCTTGDGFSCWNMNFDANGDFIESFTFLATRSVLSTDTAAARRFGNSSLTDEGESGPFFQTYVSVQVSLTGTLAGGAAGIAALDSATTATQIADLLSVTYNTGTFSYSFHEDLDAGPGGTSVAIGTFDLVSGGSDVGASDSRIELGWDTVAAADLSPVWTDQNGNAFNPFTNLLNNITQGVEVVGKQPGFSTSGGAVAIRSRGAIAGFSEFPAVSEPGALALFGIGLIGLGALARRRSNKGAALA